MQMETILARNIEAAEGKAAYDHAVKRLLANKMILAWIMKSCIEEYRNISFEFEKIFKNIVGRRRRKE